MKTTILLFAAAVLLVPMQAQSHESRAMGASQRRLPPGRPAALCTGLLPQRRPLLSAEAAGRRRATARASTATCGARPSTRPQLSRHPARGRRSAPHRGRRQEGRQRFWAGTVRFHLGEKFMDLNNAAYHLHMLALIDQGRRRHDAGAVADPMRDRGASPAIPRASRRPARSDSRRHFVGPRPISGRRLCRPLLPASSNASIRRCTLSASAPETRGGRPLIESVEEIAPDTQVIVVREGHRVGARAARRRIGCSCSRRPSW